MSPDPPLPHVDLQPDSPATVLGAVADALESTGHAAWLVGESLQRLLRREPLETMEVATSASLEVLLEQFPHAVPIRPRDDIASLPTRAGPVDLMPLRWGSTIEDDLAHRDFTIRAMALGLSALKSVEFERGQQRAVDTTAIDAAIIDPYAGRTDAAEGRLRAVGEASARLAEAPIRALRAAVTVATYGYQIDAELEDALGSRAWLQGPIPAATLRLEILRLLRGPCAADAVSLLRRTGLEKDLVPGAPPDTAEVFERLPPRPSLRMAAWLRGTSPGATLMRWRLPASNFDGVRRLLDHHPIDSHVRPEVDRSMLRFLKRLSSDEVGDLFALREAELSLLGDNHDRSLSEEGHQRLDRIRQGIARVRAREERLGKQAALALSGQRVMDILGLGPGRHVGDALKHLARWVEVAPERNSEEQLVAQLKEWRAGQLDETPKQAS